MAGTFRQLPTTEKPPGEVSFNRLFTHCRRLAERRGLVFELTREQHRTFIIQDCYYCGAKPRDFNVYINSKGDQRIRKQYENTAHRAWIKANGVDRVDSGIGYIEGNCVSCCEQCNTAKNDNSMTDFLDHAQRIVDYQEKIKHGINKKRG